MKRKETMYLLMLGYGCIIALVSLFTYGIDKDIYIGLLLGIGSLMVNYWLLTYTIEAITTQHMTFSIFPIGLGRFFIFGTAGWICYQQSHLCVLVFAAAMLAMPAAATVYSIWEVKNDSH